MWTNKRKVTTNQIDSEFVDLFGRVLKASSKKYRDRLSESVMSIVTREIQKAYSEVVDHINDVQEVYHNYHEKAISYAANLGILPMGTRYHRSADVRSVLVVERKPCVRTIRVSPNIWDDVSMDRDTKREIIQNNKRLFSVAVPYQWYIFWFDHSSLHAEVYPAFSDKPLRSLDQVVRYMPFHNISSFEPCMKTHGFDGENVYDFVEKWIELFWDTEFNRDISVNFTEQLKITPKIRYDLWERESKKSGLFPFQVKWRAASELKELVRTSQHNMHDIANIYANMDGKLKVRKAKAFKVFEEKLLAQLTDIPMPVKHGVVEGITLDMEELQRACARLVGNCVVKLEAEWDKEMRLVTERHIGEMAEAKKKLALANKE